MDNVVYAMCVLCILSCLASSFCLLQLYRLRTMLAEAIAEKQRAGERPSAIGFFATLEGNKDE